MDFILIYIIKLLGYYLNEPNSFFHSSNFNHIGRVESQVYQTKYFCIRTSFRGFRFVVDRVCIQVRV